MRLVRRSHPLHIGFLGCGLVTRGRHLPALRRLTDVSVVALCDPDPAALAAAAALAPAASRHSDWSELLEHRGVEALAVCTPPASHPELGVATLRAGRHLFVEKPPAVDLDGTATLLAAAEASGVVAAVGFNLRCHDLVRRARSLVGAGAIGRVRAIHSIFTDQLPGSGSWRAEPARGGGPLLDKGVHHADLWRFLLDDEIQQVSALSDPSSRTVALIARAEGGTVAGALLGDHAVPSQGVWIDGDAGRIEISLYRADGLVRTAPGEVPGAFAGRMRRLTSAGVQLAAGARKVRAGGAVLASYRDQWRAFAMAIRSGGEVPATLRDGWSAMAIADAAGRSLREGRGVAVAQSALIAA